MCVYYLYLEYVLPAGFARIRMLHTKVFPYCIWCCSYAQTHCKIYGISMQSVVAFTCYLHVGAIWAQYSLDVAVGQANNYSSYT